MTGALHRFARNTRGNIAILFTFMAIALFFFVGGAVDYTRMNAVRADMIESLDAAGLAVARLTATDSSLTETELTDYGKRFFQANFQHSSDVNDLVVTFDYSDAAVIAPCVQGTMDTYLLRLVHIDTFNIDTCVEITKQGTGKIELALVLDVTGSMSQYVGSERKIDSLKTAVRELLQVLYGDARNSDNLKIGMVPFNAYVNAGGASSWQRSWGDLNAESAYHGAHFIHVDSTGNVDSTALAQSYNASGIAKVMDVNRKVNHYDLYNSDPSFTWKGCVEARPYPLDELDTAPGASATAAAIDAALQVPADVSAPTDTYGTRMKTAFQNAPPTMIASSDLASRDNSRFVPMFLQDEPDCSNNACNWGASSVTASYSMGGSTRTLTGAGYFFDDPDSKAGVSENSYVNRAIIVDSRYTTTASADRFARYLDVVLGARMAINESSGALDSYWRSVKTRLAALGATRISNSSTSCTTRRGKTTCSTTANAGDEFILRNSYVGWWEGGLGRYVGKYDQFPSLTTSHNPNLNCPTEILPLTNNRDAIEAHAATLVANGYTDSANGAVWGWRLLSPEAPFTEGVAPSDPGAADWQKAVVIMTDGENTVSSDATHWKSEMTSYGYALESRMGVGIDTAAEMRDQVDEKLLRICHRMKEQGYLVYTIMFDLSSTRVETIFKACATEPNQPYFYSAVTADDLRAAFGNIAADLVDLHISK